MALPSAFAGALEALLSEASPPTALPQPAAPAAPASPFQPLSRAAAAAPPSGRTMWLEAIPGPARSESVPQALWVQVFERHRDAILANYRAAIDDALARQINTVPGSSTPMTEVDLLRSLQRADPTVVSAHDSDTGEMVSLRPAQLPLNMGVSYLRQWAQPHLLPSFVRGVLEGSKPTGALSFFEYLLMELANGEHFFGLAATTGVPAYALMRFMRGMTDGSPPDQLRLQQALDDGVDVATAAYAQLAEDPRISDEVLERAKSALVARRDLILRLKESRYAPPAAAGRASMRVAGGGMEINFTFDTQAPLPSTRFHKGDNPLTIDTTAKELPT